MEPVRKKCSKCGKIRLHTVGNGYCKKCRALYLRLKYNVDPIYKARQLKQGNVKSTERRKIHRQYINEFLIKHSCVDCGNKDIRVLEFDHKNDEEKLFTIGGAGWMKNLELVKQEIEKCDVRCANCHKIRHYEKRHINCGKLV